MKKWIMFVALVLSAAPAFADIQVGPEISHISYREKSLPYGRDVINVKEDGIFYGIHGTAETEGRLYLAADGRYAVGTVEYSGSGSIDEIENYLYEVRGLAGYRFKNIVLYSGYGYRYLNDDGEGKLTSTGLFAYERESNYQYVPIGIKLTQYNIQAEIDVLTVGEQVSHLERIDQFAPEVKNKQNSGVGVKLSVDLKKSFKRFDVALTPFVRVWKIQSSKTDDGFYEPKNTSLEVGGGLSVKF